MDQRAALRSGSVLCFPGMRCTLECETGRGSNAIVYRGWYPDLLNPALRHMVLVKELFPLHSQGGIYRDESGAIRCRDDALPTLAMHRRSFEAGNAAHLRLLERYPERIGANLNSFALNSTIYTVLGFSGGRSLDQEIITAATDVRLLVLRMMGLLDALEAFHESGLLHLDISPDNILLTGRGKAEQVMLIDYNSAYDASADATEQDIFFSIKSGYTAPEVRSFKRGSICAASDLYSVTAVFYRFLTGAALTAFQTIRPTPPDISDCPSLCDLPDSVRSWIQQILCNGLHTLPRRRYQSTAEMRAAFQELLDRIDGVGITHWALWEAGRRSADQVIRENPALGFILDQQALLPAYAASGSGGSITIDEYISGICSGERDSALLLAGGGMGKTTAMLRAAYAQPARYEPSQPAIIYISLFDWHERHATYILNRILESLHFKAETRSFDDARLALRSLLAMPLDGYPRSSPPPSSPMHTRPMLLILLDGLNEAAGTTQSLIDEILELDRLPGVALMISTRTDEPALPFLRLRLTALSDEDVRQALSAKGLLLPESLEVQKLLRTPLMLSIFLQSAQAEQSQLNLQTQDDLMQAYFFALHNKEIARMPRDTDAYWQLDVALSFVLPALAACFKRHRRALDDAALLGTVEKCFDLFSSHAPQKEFPQWIGHSAAIRNGAANAEEWYGQVVHDLLWKRLGLLVRNENGAYQISHQIIAEYLQLLHRQNRHSLRRRISRRALPGLLALSILAAGTVCISIHHQQRAGYIALYSAALDECAADAHAAAMMQHDAMRALTDCALETFSSAGSMDGDHANGSNLGSNQGSGEYPEVYARQLSIHRSLVGYADIVASEAENMQLLALSEAFGGTAEREYLKELMLLPGRLASEYAQYEALLSFLMQDTEAFEGNAALYGGLLSQLIDLDADIADLLYQLTCPPDEAMLGSDSQQPSLRLDGLKEERRQIISKIDESGLFARMLGKQAMQKAEVIQQEVVD